MTQENESAISRERIVEALINAGVTDVDECVITHDADGRQRWAHVDDIADQVVEHLARPALRIVQ